VFLVQSCSKFWAFFEDRSRDQKGPLGPEEDVTNVPGVLPGPFVRVLNVLFVGQSTYDFSGNFISPRSMTLNCLIQDYIDRFQRNKKRGKRRFLY
jgi:hypothetical protein